MSPIAIEIDSSSNGSYTNSPHDSDSDFDDAPPVKHKVPLREQFKASKPNIDWVPSWEKYMNLVARHLKAGLPKTPLPQGFQSSVQFGPYWTGENMTVESLITHLQGDGLKELDNALAYYKGLGLPKDKLSPATFPLPTLKARLEQMCHEVHEGAGVAILRGFDPARYSFEDNIIIYAGIASYIGETRGKQDDDGNVLVHIKDVGSRVAPDDKRQSPYANNAQTPFHNDLGDIIALYCMDKAREGGVSRLAPTATVYNELAAHRPDLIHELAAPAWAFDKHDGSQNYRTRPILFKDPATKRVFFCFSRRQLTGSTVSPRPAYLPALTEAQAEALDAVHFAADKHALSIQLEKGDMQFSNNLALFHAREAFKDGPDSDKRHLIRMWLRNEEHAWNTPSELQEVWDEIYGGGRKPLWHMLPNHGRAHVISRNKSCHG